MNRISVLFLILVSLFLTTTLSCDHDGHILIVGGIQGFHNVPEGTTVEYSVDAESDSEITYNWEVNPVGYGTLGSPSAASTTYTAPEVDSDFEIVISVVVNSDYDGPVVRSMDVAVKNIPEPPDDAQPINHPPSAGVYSSLTVVNPDVEVQFFDDSTDPDGIDDIVLWEWDFSYDPDDGFQVDSTEKDPVQAWSMEGVYLVQHRVKDSGGFSDLLDEPLIITVESIPKAPIASAHVNDNEISAGDYLQFYDDSTDPDGNDDIVLWEWDFSYDPDDGFNVESTDTEPLVEFPQPGIFDVQLRVTDSTGLSDMLDEPLLITVIFGQPVAWYGFTFGAEYDDRAMGIGVDSPGDVFVAGEITGIVDLDPGEGTYQVSSVNECGFVCKYDNLDFHVDDATHWDGSELEDFDGVTVEGFTSDNNGNFCVTGIYGIYTGFYGAEEVNYGGSFIKSGSSTDLNNWMINSVNTWYYNLMQDSEYIEQYEFRPVAFGIEGDIYYIDYNKSMHSNDWSWSSSVHSTLKKYSPAGQTVNLVNGVYPYNKFNSVGVSQNGIVILIIRSYLGNPINSIRHYTLDGIQTWEITPVPVSTELHTTIRTDPSGNFYFLGINDQNITKISPDGAISMELSWDAEISDIYVYDNGSFIVTGNFTETVDFDPGPGEAFKSSPGTTSGYVSAFDSDGNFQWVETWGNSEEMYSTGVTADSNGNIYVCGYFSGSIDLGPPGESDWHTSNGGLDAYVLKLSH
jgi:hypothetical protein